MKYLIPHISYLGLPLYGSLDEARETGFDGVECHLVSFKQGNTSRVTRWLESSLRTGLVIHLHQGWSIEESAEPRWPPNQSEPLHWFGYLPSHPYQIFDHVPEEVTVPVVAYPDRYLELKGRENFWFQTAATYSGSGGTVNLDYGKFVELVQELHLPVVFDTWHFLEYSLGIRGTRDLPRSPDFLYKKLEDGWKIFGQCVKEIHFNDSSPYARNVFLGKGVIPLQGFADLVKGSGWQGTVVPEVFPGHIKYGLSADKMKALREEVGRYFS